MGSGLLFVVYEIGGQDAGGGMRSHVLELPPKTRIQIREEYYSLSYVNAKTLPGARLGIHSPQLGDNIIDPSDWGNIWVYGVDILLAGYLPRGEFNQRASFIREGARVFQYNKTRTKNLGVSVYDLRPLSELLERARSWPSDANGDKTSQGDV